MKKFPLIVLCIFYALSFQKIYSQQNTCSSDESEFIEDLNSITKCTIEDTDEGDSKKMKRVNIVVSTKKRYHTKRVATGVNLNASAKINEFKQNTLLVSQLEIRNEEALKNKLPFDLVEEKPRFQECAEVTTEESAKCFQEELVKHVQKNLKYPKKALWLQMEGKVYVQFMISKTGQVANIEVKGPENGKLLAEEAERVIAKLPLFIPGKVNGKPVYVNKGVPINFVLPQEFKNVKPTYASLSKISSLEDVDQVPIFPGCENVPNGKLMDCFNINMIKHVEANFKYPHAAAEDEIQGKVNTRFIIDETGKVTDIQIFGPKNAKILERAAEKLIEKLPRFTPAKKENMPISVKYSLPIDFKLG